MAYEAVIGIEVHAELATETKLFCGCRTQFGAPPNSQTCPVCLGLPGALPALNRRAFEYALKIALALECQVDARTSFDRKNYYYPDLPKNYQISQSYHNLGRDGHLDIIVPRSEPRSGTEGGAVKRVGLWNVHLEEDAGKLVHPEAAGANYTLVDLNRAGMPLLEMVSAPDMRSSAEVDSFMRALRNVLLYAAVADCKIQEGKLRFEPSISLRPAGQKELGARVEIKNVGSISAVVKAVDFEIARQTRALESGEKLSQETRLWNESLQRTVAMRRKETSADYRYFPEPDLVQIEIDERWKEEVRRSIPELPVKRRLRFQEQLGLGDYDAAVLTDDRAMADYFEECVAAGSASAKAVANWVTNDVQRVLNERAATLAEFRPPPKRIAALAALVEQGRLNLVTAREVFAEMTATDRDPAEIVAAKGLSQISDASAIVGIVDRVLADNAGIVADWKAGKKAAFNSLVGSVMRETKGKANPQVVRQTLEQRLAAR
jgi:aspartyl-tRNA(Asn)/glutamyl-tRNA(Gln) amidotransferase subunit B